ncbi:hypothetical protein DMN91_012748 [Ooceraea biroi]|uniref:Ribonuclease P/MRP protein subunit POP5 n=1 Tax=Ooceraea biroi TaxID=2015173 RepID=A0A3L8D405_OOCBI|nr:hypothetical protein DMN91_012748 [Ooceraea biroi]
MVRFKNSSAEAKYCNMHTRIAVIRVRHGPHKFLLRAIPSVNDVAGRLVKTNILYVGATIKQCFLFIMKYQEKKLEQMWSGLRTETEREQMMTALLTFTPAMKDIK